MTDPFWLKYLPQWLQDKTRERPNLQKAISNTAWLFAGHFVRLATALLVSVVLARYLGPEGFGYFNYILAFIVLFSSIVTLGLNGVVVRRIASDPEHSEAILGSAATLQFLGGLAAYFLMLATVSALRPNDQYSFSLAAILGFILILKLSEIIKYWFESQVKSHYTVIIESAVLILFGGIKIGLIYLDASLITIAWAIFAECIIAALALFVSYQIIVGRLKRWRANAQVMKSLLQESWPLALSGVAVIIYLRIDQIMIGEMIGEQAVGLYAAALRLSEVWYLIPVVIMSSIFPRMVKINTENIERFRSKMSEVMGLMMATSLSLTLFIFLFSDQLIHLTFGNQYAGAGAILSVHAFTLLPVFLGTVSGKWALIIGAQKYAMYWAYTGAVINVVLNLILIPQFGAIGAAFATVIAQLVACILLNATTKKTRPIFKAQMQFDLIAKFAFGAGTAKKE